MLWIFLLCSSFSHRWGGWWRCARCSGSIPASSTTTYGSRSTSIPITSTTTTTSATWSWAVHLQRNRLLHRFQRGARQLVPALFPVPLLARLVAVVRLAAAIAQLERPGGTAIGARLPFPHRRRFFRGSPSGIL